MSSINSLITNLTKSSLIADCPNCYEEFALAESLLFDGTKKFPKPAESIKLQHESDLKEKTHELSEKHKQVPVRSERAAVSVGIGKVVEKILPTHKNFDIIASDCRFLAEPIDMIVFNGASENKINHISFMEIKTGAARLNAHQKMVRDAVNDNQVKWNSM